MKKCLILANGRPPKKSVIKQLIKQGYNYLICADGGANKAFKLKLKPDVILGDLDSINPEVKEFYSLTSKVIKVKRQNDTDVEKSIKYAAGKGYKDIVLLGVTGDRLDHTFCNLSIVLKFYPEVNLKIAAENSFLIPASGKIEFETIKNETISIYAFNNKTKIKSTGLVYPLNDIRLSFGEKESTSNSATGEKVELNISGGVIFIIRDFNLMAANGFI